MDRNISNYISVFRISMHVGKNWVIDYAPPFIAACTGFFNKILDNIHKMGTVMKQTVFAGCFVFRAVHAETGIKFSSYALYLPYLSDIRCSCIIVGGKPPLMVDKDWNTGFFCSICNFNSLLHRKSDRFFKYY